MGGGWPVVVRRGQFQRGDLVVYAEPDSFIPHELFPTLSKNKEPREYNGVKGERLKTIRLRGQISQGLVLPVMQTQPGEPLQLIGKDGCVHAVEEGDDVTELLGIQKWEATVPACLAGQVRGNFPSFLVKTDQERCQNIVREIFEEHKEETYEVSLKLDGSSCTIYARDGDSGVCSRNLDLKETEGNSFWKAAREQGVIDALLSYNKETGRNIALQMELCGEGIQGNQEGIQGQKLFLFDVFDIDTQTYMKPGQRLVFLDEVLAELGAKLEHTPILDLRFHLTSRFTYLDELLAYADGPSMNPKVKREGVVFKSYDSAFSFKAISNEWLLWKGKKG